MTVRALRSPREIEQEVESLNQRPMVLDHEFMAQSTRHLHCMAETPVPYYCIASPGQQVPARRFRPLECPPANLRVLDSQGTGTTMSWCTWIPPGHGWVWGLSYLTVCGGCTTNHLHIRFSPNSTNSHSLIRIATIFPHLPWVSYAFIAQSPRH